MACDVRWGDLSPSWGRGGHGGHVTFAVSTKSEKSVKSEEEQSPKTRSECWEAFQVQVRLAQATQCFVFSHRRLDGVASSALTKYLQEDCEARFLDLSFLKRWQKVDSSAAEALEQGLRSVRSVSLDGNAINVERWCRALQAHPGLQHMSLQETQLDDEAAAQLAEVLRSQSLLFSLDLSCNEITDCGAALLVDALEDNEVILELKIEGTETSEEMRYALQRRLEWNRSKYRGARPIEELLRGLRKAQAEAVTSQVQMSHNLADIESQAPSGATSRVTSPRPGTEREPRTPVTPAAGNLSRGEGIFCAPEMEEEEEAEPTPEQQMADLVWFDAGDGRQLLAELNLRCEAGWRYSAADQEEMVAFREMIKELQALRVRERRRHEEADRRLAAAAQRFNALASPWETRIFEIKQQIEDLGAEVKVCYEQKMTKQA
ncbi:Tropomodulin-3 (Ubiquitous tropomodulin) (U-Tmod), partial [Durusdinium trenchii]